MKITNYRSAVLASLGALGIAGYVIGCGGGGDSVAATVATPLVNVVAKLDCASLVGTTIPISAIGLATNGASVLAAVDVTDTDTAGQTRSYCKATGNIWAVDTSASPIKFQVNLPKSWNQRALQFGGGGTNGSVVTGTATFSGAPVNTPTPLARGYITLGSDSGHDSAGKPPFDTSFALKQEELMNFAQLQVKKTSDVAKWLSQKMYGSKPKFMYFAGGSQGGHEAFDAAQRYPEDYDGVIAHYPAYNVINMWLGAQAQAQAVYGNALGVASSAWMNPSKVALIVDAAVKACDSLDGVTDGLISNVPACNKAFTIDTVKANLRCVGGADTGNTCLSDPQIIAVGKISAPVTYSFAFAGGSTSYPRWPLLEGGTFVGNHLGKLSAADLAKFPFAADGTAFQLFPAKGGIQGFITQNLTQDPLAFDPNTAVTRIQQVSSWTDAVSTDLTRFASKGGKMLLTHGTSDDSISPHNTINYWSKLVAANSQNTVDQFARFYLIPGMGHGSGVFNAKADWLSALESWVEGNKAPSDLSVADGNTASVSASTNGRTRPLCSYPQFPKYVGTGDVNAAASFTCALP